MSNVAYWPFYLAEAEDTPKDALISAALAWHFVYLNGTQEESDDMHETLADAIGDYIKVTGEGHKRLAPCGECRRYECSH